MHLRCCLNKRIKRRVIADRTSKKFKHAPKIVGVSVLDLSSFLLCIPVVFQTHDPCCHKLTLRAASPLLPYHQENWYNKFEF